MADDEEWPITIHVMPADRTATEPLRSINVDVPRTATMDQVFKMVEARFSTSYTQDDKTLEVYCKVLQTRRRADLSMNQKVSVQFRDHDPKEDRILYMSTGYRDQHCSVAPGSTLWPAGYLGPGAPLTSQQHSRLARRRSQQDRYGTALEDLDADMPIQSREVDAGDGEKQEHEVRIDKDGFKIPQRFNRSPLQKRKRAQETRSEVLVEDSQMQQQSKRARTEASRSPRENTTSRMSTSGANPGSLEDSSPAEAVANRLNRSAPPNAPRLVQKAVHRAGTTPGQGSNAPPTPTSREAPTPPDNATPTSAQRSRNTEVPITERYRQFATESHRSKRQQDLDLGMEDPIEDEDDMILNNMPDDDEDDWLDIGYVVEDGHGGQEAQSRPSLPTKTIERLDLTSDPRQSSLASRAGESNYISGATPSSSQSRTIFDAMAPGRSTQSGRVQATPSERWTVQEDKQVLRGIRWGWQASRVIAKYQLTRTGAAVRNRIRTLQRKYPGGFVPSSDIRYSPHVDLPPDDGDSNRAPGSSRREWAVEEVETLKKAIGDGYDRLEIRLLHFRGRSHESVQKKIKTVEDAVVRKEKTMDDWPKDVEPVLGWSDFHDLRLRRAVREELSSSHAYTEWFQSINKDAFRRKWRAYRTQLGIIDSSQGSSQDTPAGPCTVHMQQDLMTQPAASTPAAAEVQSFTQQEQAVEPSASTSTQSQVPHHDVVEVQSTHLQPQNEQQNAPSTAGSRASLIIHETQPSVQTQTRTPSARPAALRTLGPSESTPIIRSPAVVVTRQEQDAARNRDAFKQTQLSFKRLKGKGRAVPLPPTRRESEAAAASVAKAWRARAEPATTAVQSGTAHMPVQISDDEQPQLMEDIDYGTQVEEVPQEVPPAHAPQDLRQVEQADDDYMVTVELDHFQPAECERSGAPARRRQEEQYESMAESPSSQRSEVAMEAEQAQETYETSATEPPESQTKSSSSSQHSDVTTHTEQVYQPEETTAAEAHGEADHAPLVDGQTSPQMDADAIQAQIDSQLEIPEEPSLSPSKSPPSNPPAIGPTPGRLRDVNGAGSRFLRAIPRSSHLPRTPRAPQNISAKSSPRVVTAAKDLELSMSPPQSRGRPLLPPRTRKVLAVQRQQEGQGEANIRQSKAASPQTQAQESSELAAKVVVNGEAPVEVDPEIQDTAAAQTDHQPPVRPPLFIQGQPYVKGRSLISILTDVPQTAPPETWPDLPFRSAGRGGMYIVGKPPHTSGAHESNMSRHSDEFMMRQAVAAANKAKKPETAQELFDRTKLESRIFWSMTCRDYAETASLRVRKRRMLREQRARNGLAPAPQRLKKAHRARGLTAANATADMWETDTENEAWESFRDVLAPDSDDEGDGSNRDSGADSGDEQSERLANGHDNISEAIAAVEVVNGNGIVLGEEAEDDEQHAQLRDQIGETMTETDRQVLELVPSDAVEVYDEDDQLVETRSAVLAEGDQGVEVGAEDSSVDEESSDDDTDILVPHPPHAANEPAAPPADPQKQDSVRSGKVQTFDEARSFVGTRCEAATHQSPVVHKGPVSAAQVLSFTAAESLHGGKDTALDKADREVADSGIDSPKMLKRKRAASATEDDGELLIDGVGNRTGRKAKSSKKATSKNLKSEPVVTNGDEADDESSDDDKPLVKKIKVSLIAESTRSRAEAGDDSSDDDKPLQKISTSASGMNATTVTTSEALPPLAKQNSAQSVASIPPLPVHVTDDAAPKTDRKAKRKAKKQAKKQAKHMNRAVQLSSVQGGSDGQNAQTGSSVKHQGSSRHRRPSTKKRGELPVFASDQTTSRLEPVNSTIAEARNAVAAPALPGSQEIVPSIELLPTTSAQTNATFTRPRHRGTKVTPIGETQTTDTSAALPGSFKDKNGTFGSFVSQIVWPVLRIPTPKPWIPPPPLTKLPFGDTSDESSSSSDSDG